MNKDIKLRIYKKECKYSYTIGAFPTIELINNRFTHVNTIYVHEKYNSIDKLYQLCKGIIPIEIKDVKFFRRINVSESSYVVGVFNKYEMTMAPDKPHIVLVNPSDMGNVGTIIRTLVGLGYRDIAIIKPAADFWSPKSIRASMGSIFKINIQLFNSFNDYCKLFKNHDMFPFMLGGDLVLQYTNCPKASLFSLIFGNESSGLDESFLSVGTPIRLPQTDEVDSYNLAIAVAMASNVFSCRNLSYKKN